MGAKLDAAMAAGRTVFPHSVIDAPETPTLTKVGVRLRALKWAGHNAKIGGWLSKGPRDWRGAPLFTLTLEERKTCPGDCELWGRCYGSNMMFAKRINVNARLKAALEADLATLAAKYKVFGVRLHVLGDFSSTGYVRFWGRQVRKYPQLRIWGYTHWAASTPIGQAVTQLVNTAGGRVAILRSNPREPGDTLAKAYVVPVDATAPVAGSVFCPNEVGRAASCGECGLCMSPSRISVSFIDHSPEAVRAKLKAARQLPVMS